MESSPAQRVCLVTGGAGFIGSHLIRKLLERGDRVVIVDDLSTGRRSNLASLDPHRITFKHCRVSEAVQDFAPGEFDEIYHLAAAVGVRLVIEQPIHTVETNILETSALLQYASASSTPTLLASSSEVYGKGSKSPFAEDDDVVYGPTIFSRWSYACSKAIDEYLALAHHQQNKLPVVVVRFFNTVGPGQVGEYGMVLPRFVKAALAGTPLEVHGDGKQSRCFCDVRDVVAALPQLMATGSCAGRVFNLGSDQSIQIGALADLVCRTLNSRAPIVYVPYEQAFGAGFDDLRERRPDLTRVRAAINFQPTTTLQQTILDLAKSIQDESANGAASHRSHERNSPSLDPIITTPLRSKESRV